MIKIFPKDKHGWVRIVEAFVAVLLVLGIVLYILDEGYVKKDDASEKIYETENSILSEIQNNAPLRQDILDANPLPINWALLPASIRNKIENSRPSYLDCEAYLCEIRSDCLFQGSLQEDLYVRSVVITSTLISYSPRELKLFCWIK